MLIERSARSSSAGCDRGQHRAPVGLPKEICEGCHAPARYFGEKLSVESRWLERRESQNLRILSPKLGDKSAKQILGGLRIVDSYQDFHDASFMP
jgi:hypothetical protein